MIRTSRLWWLGMLGLFCFGVAAAQAWERPPLRVHTQFHFQVEVKSGPTWQRPTAPWYAYFPTDARMTPSLQTSPYPPWPAQFPPPGPPPTSKDVQKQSGSASVQGPMLVQHWPNYYANGFAVQPVGFVPAQAPSYWYQGR